MRRRRATSATAAAAAAAAAAAVAAWAAVVSLHATPAAAAAGWTTVGAAPPPPGREDSSFTACGVGLFCLLGGRAVAPVAIYNDRSRSWSNGSAPPLALHHFQATTGPDGCVWVAGAWTGVSPNETAVGRLYAYCPDTDAWTVVRAPGGGREPRPRGAGGAAWYGGRLYVVGGNVGSGGGRRRRAVPWLDAYDPVARAWAVLPDAPRPRDHVSVGVVGDALVVAGGRNSGAADNLNATIAAVDVRWEGGAAGACGGRGGARLRRVPARAGVGARETRPATAAIE